MTQSAMASLARKRFYDLVTVVRSVPTEFDNAPPQSVSSLLAHSDTSAVWCRVSFLGGESSQITIGHSKVFRNPAVLSIQVFVPVGTGEKTARELAEAIVTAFRSVKVSGVTYRTPSILTVGANNGWWQLTVNCPMFSDDVS